LGTNPGYTEVGIKPMNGFPAEGYGIQYSEKLAYVGHEVKTWQVKKDVLPPEEVFDYHIIAFPVLSWSAPVIMKRYVRRMPRSKGTRMAILAVNGAIFMNGKLERGYTGQALEQVENILKRKKYDVFLTGNSSFPLPEFSTL
jgi:hypothetical protein